MGEKMPTLDVQAAVGKIIAEGPTRVVVNEGGTAVPPNVAAELYQVKPDVIFIREDGWSFGAPHHLEEVAVKMWEGDWVAFMQDDGSDVPNPVWRWWLWEESPWFKGARTTSEPPTLASPYPESDKMLAVKEKSQAIGEFLEWLQSGDVEQGLPMRRSIFLATQRLKCEDHETGEVLPEDEWELSDVYNDPFNYSIEQLLAQFFNIDLKKVEEEKRAMLAALQNVPKDSE